MSLLDSRISHSMEPPLRIHRTLEESAAARKLDLPPQAFRERKDIRKFVHAARGVLPFVQVVPMVLPPPRHPYGIAGPSSVLGRKRKSKRNGSWMNKKNVAGPSQSVVGLEDGEFRPPRLKDLWKSNSRNARRYFPKRPKVPKKPGFLGIMPDAPFNTTSYIMSSSKLGGAATPIVFPAPPAPRTVPPSPRVSSSPLQQPSEGPQELHVNPYGSMASLFRLKSTSEESADTDVPVDKHDGSDSDSGSTSSRDSSGGEARGQQPDDAAMEDRMRAQEVARDLDVEEAFPSFIAADTHHAAGDPYLRTRIDEQEIQLAQLEEENLDLREKLFVAQQEIKELKRKSGDVSEDDKENVGAYFGEEEASCAADVAHAECSP